MMRANPNLKVTSGYRDLGTQQRLKRQGVGRVSGRAQRPHPGHGCRPRPTQPVRLDRRQRQQVRAQVGHRPGRAVARGHGRHRVGPDRRPRWPADPRPHLPGRGDAQDGWHRVDHDDAAGPLQGHVRWRHGRLLQPRGADQGHRWQRLHAAARDARPVRGARPTPPSWRTATSTTNWSPPPTPRRLAGLPTGVATGGSGNWWSDIFNARQYRGCQWRQRPVAARRASPVRRRRWAPSTPSSVRC